MIAQKGFGKPSNSHLNKSQRGRIMKRNLSYFCMLITLICSTWSLGALAFAAEDGLVSNINNEELAIGFSENVLPPSSDFVGKEIKLYLENGWIINYLFLDRDTVKWEILEGEGKGDKNVCMYTATKARENIYLVDFVDNNNGTTKSVSIVIDTEKGIALVVVGQMPTKEEASIPFWKKAQEKKMITGVAAEFIPAIVNKPFTKNTERFERTRDLIGKRVQFTYSSKDAYEHIYLNDHFYTWHCLAGNERGLADTDYANYFKIADKLYLFVWQEKIIPTLGVVIEDFSAKRSYGKLFGYAGFDFSKVINIPVGSFATELYNTTYDYSRLKK